MRGTNPPCNDAIQWQTRNLEPTDEQACLRTYHDNNPGSQGDPDVGLLLAVLGYMPFAITLIAKLGMEGKSTAKELLHAWLEFGPDMLSDNPEESMNRSIRLSVDSDLVKQSPSATALLALLSLLPAGTTKQNLRWWASDSALKTLMIPSAIATLSKAALLVENKRENYDSRVLFVIPVVQSFVQHNRIEEKTRKQMQSSCCQYILDHACRYDDPDFSAKSKALEAEDTNIQFVLFGLPHSISSGSTVEALIAYSWHRCDTKPNLEIANRAAKAAKGFGVKRYIASAIWCLGCTHRELGDHRSSYNHLHEAHLLSNDPSASEMELQRLHCQCGIDLVEAARMTFEEKSEVVSLARDVAIECAGLRDESIHGRSLVLLGAALYQAGQPQEAALEYLDRARIMLKAVNNIPHLAAAYHAISYVHYYERRLPEAFDAIREACELIESVPNPNSQAIFSLSSALFNFSASRDTEAWKHTKTALEKASHVGNRLYIARALEFMGYGYLRRGDYKNAYGAYAAAAEKYHGTVDAHMKKICQDNMARIQTKQRNPDEKVGFYRIGMHVRKSLYYPVVQGSPSNDLPISEG